MADLFDPAAAATELAPELDSLRTAIAARTPAPDPRPLFKRGPDGSAIARDEQLLQGPLEPFKLGK